ncbi:DUF7552 domain-containing protein [Natrinema halophilum]|uniref:DUF7552 domain-containing protein n=1 Tax=Natrinema halophilum TaxID=1699371 RepID=A0A7D5GUI4_9EURY|nr:hypothetical protein [Natrinema halophilum]QLG50086.1 hypothetical protein HYG82_15085 [Natrinema halophilum]
MDRTETEAGDEGGVKETLEQARRLIEELSVPNGEFAVVCKDTGVVPEPVTDASFNSYEAADCACEAARQYREALGTLDRSLTRYDLVASERFTGSLESSTVRESIDRRRANGLPQTRQTVTVAGDRNDEWLRIENCPVVHLAGPDSLLDDEFVSRQLDSNVSSRNTPQE